MTDHPSHRSRILSGMRPTGKLHLGNLVGALQNWVKLQNQYDSYHFVADWHMLTTDYAETTELRINIQEMVMDWLAVGLDPTKATFFRQSSVLEHAELHLLFSMVTPLGWLERVPTYKEQLENIKDRDLRTYGFLGYPVLQAADILMYKPEYVPVGEDQVPHVELTREIARRFNSMYGFEIDPALFESKHRDDLKRVLDELDFHWSVDPDDSRQFNSLSATDAKRVYERTVGLGIRQIGFGLFCQAINYDSQGHYKANGPSRFFLLRRVFPEPQALLTPTSKLPGTDGRKMSKSYNNVILLSDPPDVVSSKVASMMTDPARKRRTDPGNPDVCPVFDHHKIFSPQAVIDRVNRECRTAAIGCVECKQLMAAHLNQYLAPIQERRKAYEQNPQKVWEVLEEGTDKARRVAQATMVEVRKAVKLT